MSEGTQSMVELTLKPCGHCGKQPTLTVRAGAAGYQCRGKTHLVWAYGTTEFEAAENWNTRARIDTPPSSSTPEVVEAVTAALVALARHNIPTDVQELLVGGNPAKGIAPGALRAAIAALPPSNECSRCKQIGEVIAKFITGGVHYAVEPELSTVDYSFALREEAGELHRLLCEIHPLDEDGCFKNGSEARKLRGEG